MKYISGIDESGITNNHNNLLKNFLKSHSLKENQRYSLITMILIKDDEYHFFKRELSEMKLKFLKDSKIKTHTADLLNKRNIFKDFETNTLKEFLFGFLTLVESIHFQIFQVFVDNESHFKKYQEKSIDPYLLAVKFLINKLIKLNLNTPIDLIIEARGYNSDIELLKNLYTWKHLEEENIDITFHNKKNGSNYEVIELTDFVSYFLFINHLKFDNNYLQKVKLLAEENRELIVMIKKILSIKMSNYSFKKIF